jgi:hypothetical protein
MPQSRHSRGTSFSGTPSGFSRHNSTANYLEAGYGFAHGHGEWASLASSPPTPGFGIPTHTLGLGEGSPTPWMTEVQRDHELAYLYPDEPQMYGNMQVAVPPATLGSVYGYQNATTLGQPSLPPSSTYTHGVQGAGTWNTVNGFVAPDLAATSSNLEPVPPSLPPSAESAPISALDPVDQVREALRVRDSKESVSDYSEDSYTSRSTSATTQPNTNINTMLGEHDIPRITPSTYTNVHRTLGDSDGLQSHVRALSGDSMLVGAAEYYTEAAGNSVRLP